MGGFLATLTEDQKIAALAYRGDEHHGDAAMAIKFSPKDSTMKKKPAPKAKPAQKPMPKKSKGKKR